MKKYMLQGCDWTAKLPSNVYERLCACRTTKEDLACLVSIRYAYYKQHKPEQEYTKEDALIYVLELLDSNGQYELADLTQEEYSELKK